MINDPRYWRYVNILVFIYGRFFVYLYKFLFTIMTI